MSEALKTLMDADDVGKEAEAIGAGAEEFLAVALAASGNMGYSSGSW